MNVPVNVNFNKALLKAQISMGGAIKDASNPFFKSKYADYNAVLAACKPHLNENGIVIKQPHVHRDGKNFVVTTLTHAESGETEVSETEVVCKQTNDPQALGSAITYARRYGLQSFLALPAEDDDGEKAMVRNTAPTAQPAKAPANSATKTEAPKAATPAPAKPAVGNVKPAPVQGAVPAASPVAQKANFARPAPAAKPTPAPVSSSANGSSSSTSEDSLGF